MTDTPANRSEPTQAEGQVKSLREELRREHQLVRSAGTVSKPVMAMAFGIVFLLVAAVVVSQSSQWLWAFILGAIGTVSVAWAVYAWVHGRRQSTQ